MIGVVTSSIFHHFYYEYRTCEDIAAMPMFFGHISYQQGSDLHKLLNASDSPTFASQALAIAELCPSIQFRVRAV